MKRRICPLSREAGEGWGGGVGTFQIAQLQVPFPALPASQEREPLRKVFPGLSEPERL